MFPLRSCIIITFQSGVFNYLHMESSLNGALNLDFLVNVFGFFGSLFQEMNPDQLWTSRIFKHFVSSSSKFPLRHLRRQAVLGFFCLFFFSVRPLLWLETKRNAPWKLHQRTRSCVAQNCNLHAGCFISVGCKFNELQAAAFLQPTH